ncbi:hypothetical protein ACNHKD_07565 [Methylocystis sp. JAN1]|uniref:rhamnosyltransferase WsaF family glycosyltransferase n=1 Tax=Methylocystis sp. JAN1 TaxID=3397211 RepID=UPI003FA21B6D
MVQRFLQKMRPASERCDVDRYYYFRIYPDVAASGMSAAEHYAAHGWREGRNPAANFHTLFFASRNMPKGALTENPLLYFARLSDEQKRKVRRAPHTRQEWLEIQKTVIVDYFDAAYYQSRYGSQLKGRNPIDHYLERGWMDGCNPSESFDNNALLMKRGHLAPSDINPLYFAVVVDNWRPKKAAGSGVNLREIEALLRSGFDDAWYIKQYPEAGRSDLEPFFHYLHIGAKLGYSPNAEFSEDFYLAFYNDIRAAVARGEIHSGFHHYLAAGEKENRIPRYDLARTLEAVMPGVTKPRLKAQAAALRHRMSPIVATVCPRNGRTLWVLMPRLNPDILFGGYKALFELLHALAPFSRTQGYRLSIVTTEEDFAAKDYFLWRLRGSKPAELISPLEVRGRGEITTLEMSPRDRFLCYSSWDALLAAPLAAQTDEPRVISLVQEYEPIFHDLSATHAMVAAGFEVPAFPLFNSRALASYLERNNLGLFKKKPDAQERTDYIIFEHVINLLPSQTLQEMRSKKERVCAVYARPEGHAARNLYEFVELALEQMCAEDKFGQNWRFIGLGSLAEMPPIDLGGGHQLEFKQKMSEQEYINYARSIDLGISLMYAPHPSVVPFEFCTTGAIVVTNTFQNRPAAFFEALSGNFVTCEPNLDSLIAALRVALVKVESFESRSANLFRPPPTTWSTTFDKSFLEALPL